MILREKCIFKVYRNGIENWAPKNCNKIKNWGNKNTIVSVSKQFKIDLGVEKNQKMVLIKIIYIAITVFL